MCMSTPDAPAAPPQPPEAPRLADESTRLIGEDDRRKRSIGGRQSTILAGNLAGTPTTTANTGTATVLGG